MRSKQLSFLTRSYYRVKPFVPETLRWGLRRSYARHIHRRNPANWPIDESAATPPEGWPGWPDGKQFAFVLTHDVESRAGLSNVRALAELEMELGFRSSFNFIPEGEYRVPDALREWLTANGFEVGVHDLHHDGHLFDSQARFQRHAQKINRYLKEWNAVGFRSGFMLRNLEWLHDLHIEYDCSTFDTDPFEPQPDGAGTIFPFLVQNGAGGYVELPYTLPQDSTLFLLLKEPDDRIWRQKLKWIADQGGLALLNVHPDYLAFKDASSRERTFPASHYRSFLEHLRDTYDGLYWHPLPGNLAGFAKASLPKPRREPRRVCMVSFSYYESDNRVMRYAETLAACGDEVDVLALRKGPEDPREEVLRGVRVIRIQDRFDKSARGRIGHLLPVLRFMRRAADWIRDSHCQAPYDLLHVHNMPDFVVFAGRYAKRHGARVILDIHDIVPEFYASKFGQRGGGPTLAALKWLERASARFADHVIIANDLWRDRYVQRTGMSPARCTAFINNVDSSIFRPALRRRDDGKLIILFPGSLQWHQGVDIALDAFRKVHAEFPNAEFHIYGDGITREPLVRQAREAGLNGSVRFFKPVGLRDIAAVMADADLGLVPKRADSFGNEAYSTKIMEFMAVGVPVVVSDTRVDRHYFDESVVRFFESGNSDSLAEEMLSLLLNGKERQSMARRASAYASVHCWDSRKEEYLSLVDSLCEG